MTTEIEVFVTTLEGDGHTNNIVNVEVSEVMDGGISLAVSDHSAKMSTVHCSSECLDVAGVTSRLESVDDKTVAAITLEVVEVGIDQGLAMVGLIEINCSLDATVVPVHVHASASGVEINVCHFWYIVVVSITGFGIFKSCGSENAVKVVVEVSVISAESVGAVSLGSRGVVGVL